jgi:hypothetical protein
MILASHGLIASQIQSFIGLLDLYPSAAAAYSLRKLRAAYTGSAIRVRRSSDNTEQDIGFSGANLDTSALTSFCGSGNGFVTTWYDQSGNSLNLSQTTAANQPKIVNSGSVILTNGKPSIQYGEGSTFTWLNTSISWSITNMSTFNVGFRTNTSNTLNTYSRLLSIYKSPTDDYIGNDGYLVALCNASLGGFNPSAVATDLNLVGQSYTFNTQVLLSSRRNTSNSYLQKNNGTISNVASSATTKTPNNLRIGGNMTAGTSDSNLQGNTQETIIYLSDQSSNQSAINTNINTYYAIY